MTSVEVATKTCTRCGETKPLTEFHRNRSAPDGRQSRCKVCVRFLVNERRAAKRAEMGDAAFKAQMAEQVRRHRQTPHGKEMARRQEAAYSAAQRILRERHRKEFDAIYARERYERGL